MHATVSCISSADTSKRIKKQQIVIIESIEHENLWCFQHIAQTINWSATPGV